MITLYDECRRIAALHDDAGWIANAKTLLQVADELERLAVIDNAAQPTRPPTKFDKAFTAYNSRIRAWISTHFGGRDYCTNEEDFNDAIDRLESDVESVYNDGVRAEKMRWITEVSALLKDVKKFEHSIISFTAEEVQAHNKAVRQLNLKTKIILPQ